MSPRVSWTLGGRGRQALRGRQVRLILRMVWLLMASLKKHYGGRRATKKRGAFRPLSVRCWLGLFAQFVADTLQGKLCLDETHMGLLGLTPRLPHPHGRSKQFLRIVQLGVAVFQTQFQNLPVLISLLHFAKDFLMQFLDTLRGGPEGVVLVFGLVASGGDAGLDFPVVISTHGIRKAKGPT